MSLVVSVSTSRTLLKLAPEFTAQRQRKLIQLLLQVAEVRLQVSPVACRRCFCSSRLGIFGVCKLCQLVLQHDPAVDQIRGRQHVQQRAAVRHETAQTRLGRLRRVRIRSLDGLQLRPERVEQLARRGQVQLLQRCAE